MTLLNILYVSGLGTNLLSRGALYKAGLYGSFNKSVIYIRADNSSLVLKAVKRDGIYIINWISKNIRYIVFSAESIYGALDLSLKPFYTLII
jgi:hypothetical protein